MARVVNHLLLLFVTPELGILAEENTRAALRCFANDFELFVFDVTRVPEVAELHGIIATPTLVRENVKDGTREHLIGLASVQQLKDFIHWKKNPHGSAIPFAVPKRRRNVGD